MSICQNDVYLKRIGNDSKYTIRGGTMLAFHHSWSLRPKRAILWHMHVSQHGFVSQASFFEKGLSRTVPNNTNVSVLRLSP